MRTFLLTAVLCGSVVCRGEEPVQLRAAIDKALPLITASAGTYIEKRDCFSCHHQSLPALAWERLRGKGIAVDDAATKKQAEFTLKYFEARREKLLRGEGAPGNAYSVGYALAGLAAERVAADATTTALSTYLLKVQRANGSWRILNGSQRPPLEQSHFTATALALRALKTPLADPPPEGIAAAIERGTHWLRATPPDSTEDAVFRLFGLVWIEANGAAIAEAVQAVLSRRNADGGWSQTADTDSDAYATGSALVALAAARTAKRTIDEETLTRGRTWLVEHQLDDGSWKVVTRAKPFQEYFESGYPHDKSQFISIAAACWAVQALADGLPNGN